MRSSVQNPGRSQNEQWMRKDYTLDVDPDAFKKYIVLKMYQINDKSRSKATISDTKLHMHLTKKFSEKQPIHNTKINRLARMVQHQIIWHMQ